MSDQVNIAELNGYLRILEMLIERLDKAGIVSAYDFAGELVAEAHLIETAWAGAYAPGTPRDDVRLLRLLATGIRGDYPQSAQFGSGVGADAPSPSNRED